MKKVYSIEGIDCANCAAKVEDKINKIKGIDEAVLNFMTSKLSIEFKSSEEKDVEQVMNEVKKIMDRFGENDLKSFRIESAGIMADESTYISSGDVIKIVQDIIKSAT